MNCIYKNSKYYAKAKADPLSIVQPIGYKFMQIQHKIRSTLPKKTAQKVIKYVSEKALTKQLSARATPFREIQRILRLSQTSQRKNYNLNGQNLEFINKNLTDQVLSNLSASFFPTWKDPELLNFIQLLSAMQVLRDNLFSIRDYALSTYLIYYCGQNVNFYEYIQSAVKQEFIQYSNEILINCPQLSRPQLRKIDYLQKQQVQNYISEIMQIGREKDELFSGVHLYISDLLPEKKSKNSLVLEETQWWSFIQFQIAVATGVLSEGQHAIIRFGGTYTSKSIQYVFLLKLAFGRIYLHKSNVGNPFTNQKYVVCQSFSKQNGRFVSQYILNNYDQILKGKDNVNMVDHKAIYQNDFHLTVNDFNNISPIIRFSKQIIKDYNEAANLEVYPSKETFAKKIQELKLPKYAEVFQKIQQTIPVLQKKELKKEEAIQKEAVIFDFEAMSNLCKPAVKTNQLDLFDLSSKKQVAQDNFYSDYMKRASMVSKIVKQQKKKTNFLKKELKQVEQMQQMEHMDVFEQNQ